MKAKSVNENLGFLRGKDPAKIIKENKYWYDQSSYEDIPEVVEIKDVFKGMDDHKVTFKHITWPNRGTQTFSIQRFKQKYKALDEDKRKWIEDRFETYTTFAEIFSRINNAIK